MFNDILFLLFYFFPAFIANAIPPQLGKIPLLNKFNYPMDFGLSFRGQRILGTNKTLRGLIIGTILAGLLCLSQGYIFENSEFLKDISPVNYNDFNPFILGTLLGFGALVGDAIESFFKRRFGIAPGEPWFPFDQIDFALGAAIFSYFYVQLDFKYYIIQILLFFVIHLAAKVLGYYLGLEKKWI